MHWSKMKKEDMGLAVRSLVRKLKNDQAPRRTRYLRNLSLYEQREIGSLSPASYHSSMSDSGQEAGATNDSRGLIRSAVETVVATIFAPQKPKPQFQTLGATWNARRAAYRYDRICEGILNERQRDYVNVWAFMIDAAVDMCIQGSMAIKVTADKENDKIDHEAIPCINLFVDPAEGRRPTAIYEIARMSREDALQKYPKDKTAIEEADLWDWYDIDNRYDDDIIEIIHAWKLPWSKKKEGKAITVVGGKVIGDVIDWTLPAFPFVFGHWTRHRNSFWGSGIADEGAGQAADISDLDQRLYIRAKLASGQKGTFEQGTVRIEDLEKNDAITWIPYTPGSQPPVISTVAPFGPAELEFRDMLVRMIWDTWGISQVSAAARREQGVSSGIAMMTLNDTKAGRQLTKAQRYENLFVDLAHQYVWRLQELADGKEYKARWQGKRSIYELPVKPKELEDDKWSASVAPASNLPYDPAGRQEMVQQLANSGIISKDTARTLIGWPDLDNELDVQNAEGEYIDDLIQTYLDADKETFQLDLDYQAPEGHIMNKTQALRRFASAWFRARIDQRQLPTEERRKAEYNIDLLSRWMQELSALIDAEAAKMQPQQPGMPQPAGPAMPPQGAPQLPPGA